MSTPPLPDAAAPTQGVGTSWPGWLCQLGPVVGAALHIGALAALLVAGLTTTALAQPVSIEALEYRIKAAFICKFTNYVEWPAHVFDKPDSPVVIGVIATEAIANEVTRTAAELTADGRPLLVRHLRRGDPVVHMHLVYVAAPEDSRLAETLAATRGNPVLVVTESRRALAMGSMINFVVVDDKVRFDVAPQAAEANNLKISARLLGVARAVEKGR